MFEEALCPGGALPVYPKFESGIRRAPDRGCRLTKHQKEVALRNALRYIPKKFHKELAPEFLKELEERGRIYGYSSRPHTPAGRRCFRGKR